ncbi:unnamed protein product [Cyclocybe aegerita]|uniref:ferric-chelate reductase (NADPH) n=1 Tax=Cyclocybe aegerita TaxID=1973307 RepID=A0A8S0X053_CYCAE|nr:unnamed protein product [Cyclocybe aegerita]
MDASLASNLVHRAATAAPANVDKVLRVARSWAYPKQVLYLLASFISLVVLCNRLSFAYQYLTRKRTYRQCKPTDWWTIPIGRWYTLNLTEVGLTAAYVGILLSWTFVNTTSATGIPVEVHYYSNRAGTIAASQLPLMAALGMRNNLISWFTGIGFDKLNFLHRMAARSLCLILWIHASGRLTLGLHDDEVITNAWIRSGVLAITSLTLLCFLTLRPIRERSYQVFLGVHFVLAFVCIVAIFFHLRGRQLTHYGAWPTMIVWGLDRFLRIVRTIAHNFGYFMPTKTSSKSSDLDASVEVLSPHFLRLTLHRPRSFRWRAGQSAYLSFPSVSTFPLEAHPFTIASIPDMEEGLGASLDNEKGKDEPENRGKKERELVFFVRVRQGFTSHLLDSVQPDKRHKVFVNGPYSSPPVLVGYNTVILIAGGSGIAFTLPLFLDLLSRVKRNDVSCQRVVFLWAIRDAEHIQWIASTLASTLSSIPSNLGLSISMKFYATGSSALSSDSASASASSLADDDLEKATPSTESGSASATPKLKEGTGIGAILELPYVLLERGRPDLRKFIRDEIAGSVGRVSVNVCGTYALTDSVREAIRVPRLMDILRGGPTVTLHVESFGG